ncbi:LacI family DNA-binding transcriptional regulator [Piscinibacter sp. XHJ-5]|uniref:LacI family DNA-binding transcriptional regulator n=1 Tax=Piscinibacter sp. XHJ-5 TaxID=3037797 RepID=UPI0024533269|nr:LacI family DNA-binding transcriptional regulator [Piscinibacter sp. XHJ-5]
MSNDKRPTTLHDVAARAGVSIATVSKFINRQQRFSAGVEARVLEAVEALAYRRNPAAHSMVTGRTGTLGLAVLDIGNPHFASMVKGANRVALALGYSLMVVDLEECAGAELQQLQALASRVDGLAVSARVPGPAMQWLVQQSRPIVWFGRFEEPGCACVRTDGRVAGRLLGTHLLERGFRRVLYAGYAASRWSEDRAEGLAAVLSEAGVPLQRCESSTPSLDGGRLATDAWFQSALRPDAVVGYNDMIAIGFMRELQRRGVHVPDEVGVAGFDNVPLCGLLEPELTSVDVRGGQQGESVIRELHGLITRERVPSVVVIEPQLVERRSTARG